MDGFFSSADLYNNNRRVGWNHDADGRLLADNDQNYTYDASGQMVTAQADSVTTQSFDGDGQRVKTVKTEGTSSTTTYYVRSSVLGGQVLTELTSSGAKQRTFVYSGNQVLAWQESPFGSPRVMWEHRDPTNASFRMSDSSGSLNTATDQEQPAELDPLGANSGMSNPYLIEPNPPNENNSMLLYPSFSDPKHPGTTYSFNGVRIPADYFFMLAGSLSTGGVEIDSNHASSSTGSNLGAKLPIFGVFCTQVIAGGIIQSKCTTEITGYTFNGIMAAGINPQNPGLYPNPPKLKGHPTQDQIDAFNDVYFDLRDRILNNSNCAKLFGGAERALRKLQTASISLYSRKPITIRGKQYINPARTVGRNSLQINTYGGLFAGDPNTSLSLGHELGHLLNIYGKDEYDATDPDKNSRNTEKVRKACF